MNTLRAGDEVDYHGMRGGRVTKVGFGTIWAEFSTPAGLMPVSGPSCAFRPTRGAKLRIGQFELVELGLGKLYLGRANGEGMETDVARVEGLLEGFWNREF